MGFLDGLTAGSSFRTSRETYKMRKELQKQNKLLEEQMKVGEQKKIKEIICPHCGKKIDLNA